jgi:hypothetical protein
MKSFGRHTTHIAAILAFAALTFLGCAEGPTQPGSEGDGSVPLLKKDGGGGKQASYQYTFTGDILSQFVATASSKDPFAGVDTEATLQFPEGTTAGAGGCDGSSLTFVPTWGEFSDDAWTGSLQFNGPRGRRQTGAGLSFITPTNQGGFIDGFLNLDVQVWGGPPSRDGTTLTFTQDIALVGAGSNPPGNGDADIDSDDRCVTFTITAVRQ